MNGSGEEKEARRCSEEKQVLTTPRLLTLNPLLYTDRHREHASTCGCPKERTRHIADGRLSEGAVAHGNGRWRCGECRDEVRDGTLQIASAAHGKEIMHGTVVGVEDAEAVAAQLEHFAHVDVARLELPAQEP